MTKTMVAEQTVLRMTRDFPVPAAAVYTAWTEPARLQQWHAPGDYTVTKAEVDLRVGGRYRITMKAPSKEIYHTIIGEYREIVPQSRLVYTWSWETNPEVQDTLVTVEFVNKRTGSQVILTHDRFPTLEQRDKHVEGWTGCLVHLAKCVQGYGHGVDAPPSTPKSAIPLVEMYLGQVEMAAMARDQFFFSDISDEESLWSPSEGIPPIAWHVGHLRISEANIFIGMGKGDWAAIGEDLIANYSMGARPETYRKSLLPLSGIREIGRRLHEESIAFLQTLSEDDIASPVPYPREGLKPAFLVTYADCLRALPIHEGHHNGEIALLRRLLGKTSPF